MNEPTFSPGGTPIPSPEAFRVENLRLSLPVVRPEAAKPDVTGVRITVANDGLRVALEFASGILSRVSRDRIDEFLAAMDQNPRLRPVRWYYASLFHVAGLRDELSISGQLLDGGMEIRARFASSDSGGVLRQLRDRARSLATVTLRLMLAATDGRLRVHVDLSPDVNSTAAKLLLNGIDRRPGITRVDDTTVLLNLSEVIAADPNIPFRLAGRTQGVDVSPTRAVIEIG